MQCASCGGDLAPGVAACPSCGVRLDVSAASTTPPDISVDDGDLTRLPGPGVAAVATGHLGPGAIVARRYRIERLLGTGGMGAVYRAVDCELNLPVALKLIRPEMLDDPATGREFLERFKRELLTARAVTHRNVLRIHDLGEDGGRRFITMPLVDGEDLHAALKSRRLPFAEALDIARQLTAGLAAAHEAGVVHRDLKPQNVLIGGNGTVYISDFGLAKSIEAATIAMTRTGEFVGTPQYISPEQVEGHPADHRSDLYALGLIFYEMVCGRVPFAAPSALETMLARVRGLPPPPAELDPTVPEFFSGIVMRCLEKDPADRYQNAADVLADLQAERAPSALAPARGDATGPPLTARRARMPAVAFFSTAAVVLAVGGFAYLRSSPPAPGPERPGAGAAAPLRLAILPFTVVTGGDDSLGHVADGLREWLTTKLVQLDAVALSSPSAVDAAAAGGGPPEIAARLGAAVLVGGTVQKAGDRVSITVYADRTHDRSRIWAREYSGLMADLLALQDRVVHDVIEGLELTLDQDDLASTVAQPTGNLDAYDLYLRGRAAMRNDQDLANVEAALALFEQARQRDPRFSLAYAGIADASLRLYRGRRDETYVQRALAAAEQAVSIDGSSAEAHSALGNVYQATARTAEAIVELKRAAELAPNFDEAYRRLGRVYLAAGRGEEALEAYRRAVAINPYHWVNHGQLGAALLDGGDYAGAVQAFEQVTALEPGNAVGFSDLGVAHFFAGEVEEAVAAFERAIELDPETDAYSNLGAAYAYLGQYARAIAPLERAVAINPGSELERGNLADVYRFAGRPDDARASYEKAIELALADLKVNPRNTAVKQRLALYYAKLGDHARAGRWIGDAKQAAPGDGDVLYAEALVLAFAGRLEPALAALEAALRAGYPRSALEHDPDARVLRDAPGFARLAS